MSSEKGKPRHKFVAWCSVGLKPGGGYIDRCAHCGLFRQDGTVDRQSINFDTGVGRFSSRVVPFYSRTRKGWSVDKPACDGAKSAGERVSHV